MVESTEADWWPAPYASKPIDAEISLPGSKSLTNRELVLSALATGVSHLRKPLLARDTRLMMAGLEKLGTSFEAAADELKVNPKPLTGPAEIDCGLAGTVMRFLPTVAALSRGDVRFDGDEQARARPLDVTLNSLRALGVEVISGASGLPFTVRGIGKVQGGELKIDASQSSQFISGLLLAAARFENGLTLIHEGATLPSVPHIEMTLECLRARGVSAEAISKNSWRVEPGEINGRAVTIEPDLSNAGPFLAAAAVTQGRIRIADWPSTTAQVGADFIGILKQFGAELRFEAGYLEIQGLAEIKGVDLNLKHAGELTPTIAALAALATTPSRLTGIAHLRGHETDRLAALAREINALGGAVSELEDGLVINPRPLRAGKWHSYHDHRMATAGAIIGLRVRGVQVENIATTGKTMPNFPVLWHGLMKSSEPTSR